MFVVSTCSLKSFLLLSKRQGLVACSFYLK
jgi:hypothetical protein